MTDLSQLPPPAIVATLDYETLLAERKARLLAAAPPAMRDALAAVLQLESEPLTIDLQQQAYSELVLRQYINECAQATMLAYARGADLDHRAADYDVQRLLITPASPDTTPPTEAVWEDDDSLRRRCLLAFDGLSVAGSRGAYLFHTLSASAEIADASVDAPRFAAVAVPAAVRAQLPAGAIVLVCTDPAGLTDPLPGDVVIAILPTATSQTAPASLASLAQTALSADDVRPLTDRPRVQPGTATPFLLEAVIEPESGPDADIVLASARSRIQDTVHMARKLGGELPLSAIYAALHAPGVRRVRLLSPVADIMTDRRHYPACTGIHLMQGTV